MGQADRLYRETEETTASPWRTGTRAVPSDWFVDPADPDAAKRYEATQAQTLEDQATAFLAEYDLDESGTPSSLHGGIGEVVNLLPERSGDAPETVVPLEVDPQRDREARREKKNTAGKTWVGLPSLFGVADEGELAWQSESLCAQTDPEAFFPEKGGSTRDAKKVCVQCTVRQECLDYALKNDERFGIWGGMSERERRRLRKRAV